MPHNHVCVKRGFNEYIQNCTKYDFKNRIKHFFFFFVTLEGTLGLKFCNDNYFEADFASSVSLQNIVGQQQEFFPQLLVPHWEPIWIFFIFIKVGT